MKFFKTDIAGAFLIQQEPIVDNRGYYARRWCLNEFKQADIQINLVQANFSHTIHREIIRGLHYLASSLCRNKDC